MKLSTKPPGFRVTPEKAEKFIELSIILMCMSNPFGKNSKVSFDRLMYPSILISVTVLFPLISAIINFSDNIYIVLKSVMAAVVIFNYIIKLLIIKFYYQQFERAKYTIKKFITETSESNKEILQKYVDKCWKFQFFMITSYYFAGTGIILGPLVLPQKFPTDAVYPFSVENSIVSTIIYAHQSFVTYQCVAGLLMDGQAAFFIWYLNAKFEIIISETNKVINLKEMRQFIKKHQDILTFTNELIPPIRALVFTTVSATKIIIISSGFLVISDEPLPVKIQFGVAGICVTLNTFLYSWAADNLIKISGKAMSDEIFQIFWRYYLEMKKSCLFIIHRTQKPVKINIPGLLETISIEYYSSFISAAFSCFATLRVIVNS